MSTPATPAPVAGRTLDLGVMADLVADATRSDYERVEESGTLLPRPFNVAVIALCVFLLILAAGRTRAEAPALQGERLALAERVQSRTDAVAADEARIAAQRRVVAAAEQAALAATASGRVVAERITSLERLAGATASAGPGLTLTISNPTERDADPLLPSLARVLDRDLQAIVNGLWQAGAAAVAINDQRLTARTAIRSAGAAILVDYRPVLPPYRVSAVAADGVTAVDLSRAFSRTAGAELLRQLRTEYGIESTQVLSGTVTVPGAVLTGSRQG